MITIVTLATDNPQVIQVGLIESLLGIGAIILGMGVAWGTLKTSVKHVSDDVRELKQEVKKLHTSLSAHTTDIVALQVHTKYGVSNSPIQPNNQGKKLLKNSKFDKQYPQLQAKIFAAMDKMNLRTLYDYERGALETLIKFKDDPLIDPLKEFAVNNPAIPLDDIFLVGSWVIRDDYAAYRGKKA